MPEYPEREKLGARYAEFLKRRAAFMLRRELESMKRRGMSEEDAKSELKRIIDNIDELAETPPLRRPIPPEGSTPESRGSV